MIFGRFGRRVTIGVSLVALVGLAFVQMFVHEYILFSIVRFAVAVALTGAYQTAFVLCKKQTFFVQSSTLPMFLSGLNPI